MDRVLMTAAKIEQQTLENIDAAYKDILAPVLKKHRGTLARLEKLIGAGAVARARVLWRKSGIIDDLAAAIAGAGAASAAYIRQGLTQIREAVADETG